jgi:hypothetical protein
VTIGTETRRAVSRALDLTRSRNPRGDLTLVVERALVEYTERLEARKAAKLRRGRPSREAVVGATPEKPVVLPRPAGSPDVATAMPTPAAATAAPGTARTAAPTPAAVRAPVAATAPTVAMAPMPATAPAAATNPTAATPAATDAPSPALARKPTSNGPRTPEPCPSARPRHRPHIPRAVIREVRERDANQCAYVSPETGRRCTEASRLELHHVVPFARGGEAVASNLSLRCRSHNAHHAVLDFGAEYMAEAVRRRRRQSASERARERPRRRG